MRLVRRQIDEHPTYGCGRVTALANRGAAKAGHPPFNHKLVFRIRHAADQQTGCRIGGIHDRKVIVLYSNLRRCSDSFEINCWNGDLIQIAFIIDAYDRAPDREIIAWHAVAGSGISGDMVQDMMLEAVESRFGTLQGPASLEWLTDNGSA